MKSVLIIKNILTPYRVHFFNILNNQLGEKKIKFNVILTAASEGNRSWNYGDYDLDYSILLKNLSFKVFNRYLHFGFGLSKLIDEIDPDLIILAGYYYQPNNLLILNKKYRNNHKIIFWSESNNLAADSTHPLLKKIRFLIRNYVYKRVDGFMSPGHNSDDFINKLSNGQPIIRIPNLIDNNKFLKIYKSSFDVDLFKIEFNINSFKFVLFTASRLERIKGIKEMILKISNSAYRNEIVYVIAGEGSLKSEILSLAEKLSVNIRLVGYVEENKLIKFHTASYCFVLSSLSDASPLSVIESLWLSKPLLLSKFVGNVPETLVENKNGLLMDMTNDSAVEIDKLLSLDEVEYQSYCNESLRIAKKNFDSERKTQNFINDLLNFEKGK